MPCCRLSALVALTPRERLEGASTDLAICPTHVAAGAEGGGGGEVVAAGEYGGAPERTSMAVAAEPRVRTCLSSMARLRLLDCTENGEVAMACLGPMPE